MPVQYPIPPGLMDTWGTARQKLIELIGNVFDPNQNAVPPEFKGFEAQRPTGIPGMIAGGIMPETPKEAYTSGMIGPMPLEIAANYRSPEVIKALRQAMAQENRARGPMARNPVKSTYAYELGPDQTNWISGEAWPVEASLLGASKNDPIDQILRGSWFHGMRPEARDVAAKFDPKRIALERARDEIARSGEPFGSFGKNIWPDRDIHPLLAVNEHGLPASTHATPSYTRFGEPYGVSITASPSIAKNFSADDYIHRVQPLYGGPPPERIIPMWRPEGQKAMNEGYNVAVNKFFKSEPGMLTAYGQEANRIASINPRSLGREDFNPVEIALEMIPEEQTLSRTGKFNTLYSKALQDKGYRGILYSPQRYGEYEMLMLDPSYVRPLDYRKTTDYAPSFMNQMWDNDIIVALTPGAKKGYRAAEPEFATGATSLSDVFSQQPWVDRINDENKRRILEMIDSNYREQIGNQLFRR